MPEQTLAENMISFSTEVSPLDERVLHLNELLAYEYIGMYGEPDPNPDGGLEFASGAQGSIILMHLGERTIGITGVTLEGKDAVLHRMFVRWEYRNHGLAKKLLMIAESESWRLGARRLLLETGTSQVRAIRLYAGQGYTAVDPFGFYAESPHSVFLGKVL